MVRPCYLVVDPEHGGSISTRKLVIETAKLNVITAYSSAEAIETLQKFPALDGAVLDAAMKDMPCDELVRSLKAISQKISVIVVGRAHDEGQCEEADIYLPSFDPVRLLEQIRKMHRPLTEAISAREAEMSGSGK